MSFGDDLAIDEGESLSQTLPHHGMTLNLEKSEEYRSPVSVDQTLETPDVIDDLIKAGQQTRSIEVCIFRRSIVHNADSSEFYSCLSRNSMELLLSQRSFLLLLCQRRHQ